MKSMGISSALVSPYNEVAVQTEPQAAPDRVDAEVQTSTNGGVVQTKYWYVYGDTWVIHSAKNKI